MYNNCLHVFLLRSDEWKSFAECREIREAAGYESSQISRGQWAEETNLNVFKDQGHLRETVPDPRLSGIQHNYLFSTHTVH